MDKSKYKLIPLHGDIIPDVVSGLKAINDLDVQIINLQIEKQCLHDSVYDEIDKVHGDIIHNRPVAIDPTGHFILVYMGD